MDEPLEHPPAVDVIVLEAMDPDDAASPDEQVIAKGRCPECGLAAAHRQERGSPTLACAWCDAALDVVDATGELEGRTIRRITRWRRHGDPAKRRPGRVPPALG